MTVMTVEMTARILHPGGCTDYSMLDPTVLKIYRLVKQTMTRMKPTMMIMFLINRSLVMDALGSLNHLMTVKTPKTTKMMMRMKVTDRHRPCGGKHVDCLAQSVVGSQDDHPRCLRPQGVHQYKGL